MGELDTFISDARGKGWGDDQIRQTLTTSGWSEAQVAAGLSGLMVPMPPTAAPAAAMAHPGERPSISALQAALHHVLLWLFTGTSSVMVSVVAFALFGQGGSGASSEALLTYVVLELVTFVPFAFLYWRYLQQMRRRPETMTGRVWSIITVVLHSIGLIGATISLVLVIVLVHDSLTKSGVISSLVVGAMDALVVAAYVMANFAKNTSSALRRKYLLAFPVALFVLMASLGIAALVRVGPLRTDDQTMQNLSTAVTKIHSYSENHQALPDSLSQVSGIPAGVTYEPISSYEYKVCATFKADHGDGSFSSEDDAYVDSSQFDGGSSGPHCWDFTNMDLQSGGSGTTTTPQIYNDSTSTSNSNSI